MRKMKKVVTNGHRIFSMLVAATLLAGIPRFASLAMEKNVVKVCSQEEWSGVETLEAVLVEDFDFSFEIMPYTMLADCMITARGASDGMHIDISTGTVGIASVLGIKDVKIYKKTWYGGWDLVAVCSGGESYDRGSMGISILYENAVKDATYKITCIHYGDVDGYIEGENDSGPFVFTY